MAGQPKRCQQQSPRAAPMPIVDRGTLWCSCDMTMPAAAAPALCPGCGRDTTALLREAAHNGKVLVFVESKPLSWGCPGPSESGLDWWARMVAAYEQTHWDASAT